MSSCRRNTYGMVSGTISGLLGWVVVGGWGRVMCVWGRKGCGWVVGGGGNVRG